MAGDAIPIDAENAHPSSESTEKGVTRQEPQRRKRDTAFWMVFLAGWACDMLSALDFTAVSTALPTIVEKLDGDDFIWAGSAYALASTAFLPMCGGLASTFGRKPILLISIASFAIGSAICGAAQNMSMLIAGRALQGFGGGGCIAITEIIYADLVPLTERGLFLGINATVWAFSCGIGPPVGGALASSGAWRWLFWLNIPVCVIAFAMVFVFLRVKAPKTGFRGNMSKIDWIGNIFIIGSTASIVLALTWGGLRHPWSSAQVIVPLAVGAAGIVCFFFVEVFWSSEPTMPWRIIANRTSVSGYLQTLFHGIVCMAIVYYLPVYFQAVTLASPLRSGVDMFGLAFTIAPFAMITGASVQMSSRYRPQHYIAWIFIIIGFGLLSMLDIDSPKSWYIGFQTIMGIGLGAIWVGTQFPILSPLPFSNNARALAFFTFVRSFAQSWGVAIGGSILQNGLSRKLPPLFLSQFPTGIQIAYGAIPKLPSLPPATQLEARIAFVESLKTLWRVMIGLSGAGLLSVLPMGEVPMKVSRDEQWDLEDTKAQTETEKITNL
ncbi:iron permease [Flammula alnicola]|nr:iron permease [Flammula alnicola]